MGMVVQTGEKDILACSNPDVTLPGWEPLGPACQEG